VNDRGVQRYEKETRKSEKETRKDIRRIFLALLEPAGDIVNSDLPRT
jgi:hypothetical protein